MKLQGVPEVEMQYVRQETTRICQAILLEERTKLPEVIDIVHRLGSKRPNNSKPRSILMQFTQQVYSDAVWKAAKKSTYLQTKRSEV